jgi:hypothetical protein
LLFTSDAPTLGGAAMITGVGVTVTDGGWITEVTGTSWSDCRVICRFWMSMMTRPQSPKNQVVHVKPPLKVAVVFPPGVIPKRLLTRF